MAGVMERLKMPEAEPVQNKMISRSVENAQKKIEGFHFDARKHVVQYDDVMNVHREKMYAERRKFLGSEVVLEDVETIIKELAEQIVAVHAPTPQADKNWNVQEILETVHAIHLSEKSPLQLSELQAFLHQGELIENVENYLLSSWDKKKSSFPDDQVDKIAKYVVLRSIDELWLEHINAMTSLRDQVALSGYAQKDPVMEYKRESFEMFRRLLSNIRSTCVTNLFRVEFQQETEMETADYSDAVTNDDEIESPLRNARQPEGSSNEQGAAKVISSDSGRSVTAEKLGNKYAEAGRNDPCPCGSGQKFKKCHGKEL
jgi:preprotein translocase subunit SecA